MSMIFRFTMLSDENDNFVRDYEVEYDMPLADFHNFICSDLKYDASQMASFFTSNREWEKLREYTLFDMGDDGAADEQSPLPMDGVILSNIIHNNNDRLIYIFDFLNERGMYLELMETHKKPADGKYPRCVISEGAAPGQFESDATQQQGSIFDDVMEEFNDFDGDDSYDDE